jgi:hypothetical protein
MGKVAEMILELQKDEGLTLPELFKKYPDLAKLQYEEQLKENSNNKKSKKQLLKG